MWLPLSGLQRGVVIGLVPHGAERCWTIGLMPPSPNPTADYQMCRATWMALALDSWASHSWKTPNHGEREAE